MRSIHHVVDIDAGTGTVWRALTEPSELAGWWSTEVAGPAPSVGARIEFTFADDFNPVMEVTALTPGELGWRCVGGSDDWRDSTFRFTIAESDGRTRLRFRQEYAVDLAGDYYATYNFNWAYYLESLRQYCVSGVGTPFRSGTADEPIPLTNLPDEPAEYTARREQLRHAEIALIRHREQVAALRRSLPVGPAVADYVFEEGPNELAVGDTPVHHVRLSELFTADDRPLVLYHLMYGKRQTVPCPMCTMWIDGFNGIARHLAQNVDFAVVAAADVPSLRAHARARGWTDLRLLSAAENTFKYDLASEDADGHQDSTISVFTRDPDGTVHHRYTTHPALATGIRERGIDLLSPVWHVLDLTPHGRGSWYPSLDYRSPALT